MNILSLLPEYFLADVESAHEQDESQAQPGRVRRPLVLRMVEPPLTPLSLAPCHLLEALPVQDSAKPKKNAFR